jgi:TRAP-type C4-dicarboxylate transport system permease small subunit
LPQASRPSSARRAFDRLIDALAVIAGALLCVLAALICANVAARSLHLFAMPWTLDVSEYSLYVITFFGAPWVLRENGHIAIELAVERLPERARRRLQRAMHALGALVCAILFGFSCVALGRSYASHALVYQTFVFSEWYLYSVAPPVFLILFALFTRWVLRPEAAPGGEARGKGS